MTELPPSPPPVLEYQRLERARSVAIGGLRLLGILVAGVSGALFCWILKVNGRVPPYVFVIFAILMFLGLVKVMCGVLIARRARAPAVAALTVVGLEAIGIFWLLSKMVITRLNERDGVETVIEYFRIALIAVVLVGWLAVAYEVFQVLRLEGRPRILPPSRGCS